MVRVRHSVLAKRAVNAMAPKHPPGEPMTLGNMRHLGVQRLAAFWLNDACRHQGLIDVSKFPAEVVACAPDGVRHSERIRAADPGKQKATDRD
jgi:hypothetical protein